MKNFKLLLAGAAVTPILMLAGDPYVTELTAGGGQGHGVQIGTLEVSNDADTLTLDFAIDAFDPSAPLEGQVGKWCVTEYQIDVQDTVDLIPQTNSNAPKIGLFQYKDEVGACQIPPVSIPMDEITSGEDGTVAIAAHADARELLEIVPDLTFDGLYNSLELPQEVTLTAYAGKPGRTYQMLVIQDSEGLNGWHDGWCVDLHHTIPYGDSHTSPMTAHSSYDDIFLKYATGSVYDEEIAEHIGYPHDLPLINYIINNYTIDVGGAESPIAGYGMCDIQQAIWTIVSGDTSDNIPEGEPSHGECSSYDSVKKDAIVEAAREDALSYAEGDYYKPECGERVGIIFMDHEGEKHIQATMRTVPVQCKGVWGEETVWGGDYPDIRFNDSDWAIWFNYEIQTEVVE